MAGHHPWDPKSHLIGVGLSDAVGLKRTGVSIVRTPPGKESHVYDQHHREEESIYILSGQGIAEIDDKEYQVGTGGLTPGVRA